MTRKSWSNLRPQRPLSRVVRWKSEEKTSPEQFNECKIQYHQIFFVKTLSCDHSRGSWTSKSCPRWLLSSGILTWTFFLTFCDSWYLLPHVHHWKMVGSANPWGEASLQTPSSGFLFQVHNRLNTDFSEQQKPDYSYPTYMSVLKSDYWYTRSQNILEKKIISGIKISQVIQPTVLSYLLCLSPLLPALIRRSMKGYVGFLLPCVMSDGFQVMPLLYVSICKKKEEKKKEKLKVGWKKNIGFK